MSFKEDFPFFFFHSEENCRFLELEGGSEIISFSLLLVLSELVPANA